MRKYIRYSPILHKSEDAGLRYLKSKPKTYYVVAHLDGETGTNYPRYNTAGLLTLASGPGWSKGSAADDRTAEGTERAARSDRTAPREVTISTRLRDRVMHRGVSYDATSGALCLPSGRLAAAPESAKFAPKRRLGSGPSMVVGLNCFLPARKIGTCLSNSDYPVRSEFREGPWGYDPQGLCEKGETPCAKLTHRDVVRVSYYGNPHYVKPPLAKTVLVNELSNGRLGRSRSAPRHASNLDGVHGGLFSTRAKHLLEGRRHWHLPTIRWISHSSDGRRTSSPRKEATILQPELAPADVAPRTVRRAAPPKAAKEGGTKPVTQTPDRDLYEGLLKRWDAKTAKFTDLLSLAASESLLWTAYEKTRRAKGATTPGGDSQTQYANLTFKIRNLSEQLLQGSYAFGTGRRVMIPKPDGGKRPLTVLSPWDKVVCNALLLVMEPIYEGINYLSGEEDRQTEIPHKPAFQSLSHGFRPRRSCHTALRDIKTWSQVSWFIDIDIAKCFDSINQKRLLNLLRERIDDQRLFDLISRMFASEVLNLELGGPDARFGFGVPQGNPLSPLLCNIYMDRLDKFLLGLKEQFDVGAQLQRKESVIRAGWVPEGLFARFRESDPAKYKELRRQEKNRQLKSIKKANKTHARTHDQHTGEEVFRRMHMVRYADDFLIGVRGTRAAALWIMDSTVSFLRSDLHLECKRAQLLHSRTDRTAFLGFILKLRQETRTTYSKRINSLIKLRARAKFQQQRLDQAYLRYTERAVGSHLSKTLLRLDAHLSKYRLSKSDLRRGAKTVSWGLAKRALLTFVEDTDRRLIPLANVAPSPSAADVRTPPRGGWSHQQVTPLLESDLQLETKQLGRVLTTIGETLDDPAFPDIVMQRARDLRQALREMLKPEVLVLEREKEFQEAPTPQAKAYARGRTAGSSIAVMIDLDRVTNRLRSWGMVGEKTRRPKLAGQCIPYHDASIIDYFAAKARGLLNYYSAADNFGRIKTLVSYQMCFSLLHTLAAKHKKKVHEIAQSFGQAPQIYYRNKAGALKLLAGFPTKSEVNRMSGRFSYDLDPHIWITTFQRGIGKLSIPRKLFDECAVVGCSNPDIHVHHVNRLHRKIGKFIVESIKSAKGRTLKNPRSLAASALSRNQIPLCKVHHQAAHNGSLDVSTLDKHYVNQESFVLGGIRLVSPRKRGPKASRSRSLKEPQRRGETVEGDPSPSSH